MSGTTHVSFGPSWDDALYKKPRDEIQQGMLLCKYIGDLIQIVGPPKPISTSSTTAPTWCLWDRRPRRMN